jgi:fructoselysine-6-phosphate deglycase
MLNFESGRFLRIQTGAAALAPQIHETIGACLAKGAGNLFFLGTGGAAILMQPAALLLQRRSRFPVFTDISAELVAEGHAQLGARSIVVIPSLSGTTKESIEALDLCRAKGATVIALVGEAQSPLARQADHAFVNPADDETSCESFYVQSLLVGLSLMQHLGEIADFAGKAEELSRLPALLVAVKQEFDAAAAAHAEAIGNEPWHLIAAAGNCWPEAWYFGMCILEEMQWVRTRPVHAADFFHGPLELVEKGVSVMVLKGEDQARPLAERVERFARQYTDKTFVLDTASFGLAGISAATRALVSPVVLATALERLAAHLAVKRRHPLTVRRYYKRVPY